MTRLQNLSAPTPILMKPTLVYSVYFMFTDGVGDAGLGEGASRGCELCAGGEAALHPAHRCELAQPLLCEDGPGLRHTRHPGPEHAHPHPQVREVFHVFLLLLIGGFFPTPKAYLRKFQ